MITERRIHDPSDNSFYVIKKLEDVEYVDPIEYWSSLYFYNHYSLERELLPEKYNKYPEKLVQKILLKRAAEYVKKENARILSQEVPSKLFEILEISNKREQKKILRDIPLTNSLLLSFYYKAGQNNGFKFSSYTFLHDQKGLDTTQLPTLIHYDNNKLTTIGNTSLSSGQLKQAIMHRRGLVARFLDKGDKWHCFFQTYKSVGGKETSYKGGQPHIHFTSSTFGLSRKETLVELSKREYKIPSFHLELKNG